MTCLSEVMARRSRLKEGRTDLAQACTAQEHLPIRYNWPSRVRKTERLREKETGTKKSYLMGLGLLRSLTLILSSVTFTC